MKECFGKYDYRNENCLECPERINCMLKRFDRPSSIDYETSEWSDEAMEPNCFGSFKGKKECEECPFRKSCKGISENMKAQIFRQGKHIRLKRKERGKWQVKRLF